MIHIKVNLLLYFVAYALFFIHLWAAKKKGANRITTEDGTLVYSPMLLLLHAAGIGLFGILPFYMTKSAPISF